LKHGCARKTVARKITFLAQQARQKTAEWLASRAPFGHVQWDELISFEHTRLKPLSVAVMSAVGERCLLGFGVAQIPASGPIAQKAREKYGLRSDRSGPMRKRVLRQAGAYLSQQVLIETDEHTRYRDEITAAYPRAPHLQYPSVRGSLTGQGELKRCGYDPLCDLCALSQHTIDTVKIHLRLSTVLHGRRVFLNDSSATLKSAS